MLLWYTVWHCTYRSIKIPGHYQYMPIVVQGCLEENVYFHVEWKRVLGLCSSRHTHISGYMTLFGDFRTSTKSSSHTSSTPPKPESYDCPVENYWTSLRASLAASSRSFPSGSVSTGIYITPMTAWVPPFLLRHCLIVLGILPAFGCS